jgi:diguanylate cyclase (GGDEF)-like protein
MLTIRRLRDKLLLGAVGISIVVALASMMAVSLVIQKQDQNRSNTELRKAFTLIEDALQERKNNQLAATRGLATQNGLGSTIWYLVQYAQSDVDQETLFSTYQQLVKDTYKLGRVAKLTKTAIYDAQGHLVSFALLDSGAEMAGFVERHPAPLFQMASLKDGEALNRHTLRTTNFVPHMPLAFTGTLAQQESVHFAVVDGVLSIESHVPIMGVAFDPGTGKQDIKQLGLVSTVQSLDKAFVDQLARMTDHKINVFTPLGLSSAGVAAYQVPDWSGTAVESGVKTSAVAFNEIVVDGKGYYQGLMRLYNGMHPVGTIAALNSKEDVEKNTHEMVKILGLIAIACLLLILPFAWYFAAAFSRPLTVLGRIFNGIANGKKMDSLGHDLKLLEAGKNRHDEMGALTASFMLMADSVRQNIQHVHEVNASLEEKIAQSTAQLRAANAELVRLANIDALSGLYNRRAFFEIATLAHAQARRSGSHLTLIMLDVDHFKRVNDHFGHPVGDEVLCQVANCLAITARESDTAARCGGEEFVVLAPDTDVAAGMVLAERIREAIGGLAIVVAQRSIEPTASFGVACLRAGESLEQLCARADQAMYKAKAAGRNQTIEAS